MKTWIRETRYECGDYLDVDIYPVHAKTLNRRKKAKPTSETQQKLNDARAEKKLVRIANANFKTGDIKVTLTYDKEHHPESDEEAARQLSTFLRRVKRYRASKGLDELKYIVTTEKGKMKGRIHHHLIMNRGLDQQEIYDFWNRQGFTEVAALIFDENGIQTLVDYMLKQAREFEGKKKYSRSRNLIVPQPKKRDNRFSKKQLRELARDTTNRAEYEKLYEGYFLSQAEVVCSEEGGDIYIYARFYKKEAAWCKPKQRKRSSK